MGHKLLKKNGHSISFISGMSLNLATMYIHSFEESASLALGIFPGNSLFPFQKQPWAMTWMRWTAKISTPKPWPCEYIVWMNESINRVTFIRESNCGTKFCKSRLSRIYHLSWGLQRTFSFRSHSQQFCVWKQRSLIRFSRRLQFLVLVRTIRPWMWFDAFYYRFTHEGALVKQCINSMRGLSTWVFSVFLVRPGELRVLTRMCFGNDSP